MRRCSLSAPKTFAPGPMKSSVPPTCPKSALSPLPLIRQLPPLTTTRIRDEKCYASGASRHQPRVGVLVHRDRLHRDGIPNLGLVAIEERRFSRRRNLPNRHPTLNKKSHT